MTHEKALIAINKDLEKARADNDLTKFYDIKLAKHVLLKEMGDACARDYIELYGDIVRNKEEHIEMLDNLPTICDNVYSDDEEGKK
jgi:hypothetical protein